MTPALTPIPSAGLLKVMRRLAYASSLGGALIIEDRRRRINFLTEVTDNAKRLRESPRYRASSRAGVTAADETNGLGQHQVTARELASCSPFASPSSNEKKLPRNSKVEAQVDTKAPDSTGLAGPEKSPPRPTAESFPPWPDSKQDHKLDNANWTGGIVSHSRRWKEKRPEQPRTNKDQEESSRKTCPMTSPLPIGRHLSFSLEKATGNHVTNAHSDEARARNLLHQMRCCIRDHKPSKALELYESASPTDLDATDSRPYSGAIFTEAVRAHLAASPTDLTPALTFLESAYSQGRANPGALIPILLHQMMLIPPEQSERLQRLVMRFYQLTEHNQSRTCHHIAVHAANILLNQLSPEPALDLLKHVQNSKWAAEKPFDIVGMTVLLRAYAANGDFRGVLRSVKMALEGDLTMDEKFVKVLETIWQICHSALSSSRSRPWSYSSPATTRGRFGTNHSIITQNIGQMALREGQRALQLLDRCIGQCMQRIKEQKELKGPGKQRKKDSEEVQAAKPQSLQRKSPLRWIRSEPELGLARSSLVKRHPSISKFGLENEHQPPTKPLGNSGPGIRLNDRARLQRHQSLDQKRRLPSIGKAPSEDKPMVTFYRYYPNIGGDSKEKLQRLGTSSLELASNHPSTSTAKRKNLSESTIDTANRPAMKQSFPRRETVSRPVIDPDPAVKADQFGEAFGQPKAGKSKSRFSPRQKKQKVSEEQDAAMPFKALSSQAGRNRMMGRDEVEIMGGQMAAAA